MSLDQIEEKVDAPVLRQERNPLQENEENHFVISQRINYTAVNEINEIKD